MATKRAPKKAGTRPSAAAKKGAAKKASAKKTPAKGGRRKAPKVQTPEEIGDYVVLLDCDAKDEERRKAEALLAEFESRLADAKVVSICKLPSRGP
jgi:hypothetical protein